MSVIITDHSVIRASQRLGLNKSALVRTAQLALDGGIGAGCYSGSFRRYLDKLSIDHRSTQRIHGKFIFCFFGETLATVLSIPQKYRNVRAVIP